MAHTESITEVAGTRIKLMRSGSESGAGSKPTMLFLHGAGGASVWLPFMESLAQQFNLLVPEHPGFGDSDTPDWLQRVDDLAYYYLDLLEALDLRQVHLVGHSLGGWTAAALAVKDCSRLASLTLISAAGVHVRGVERIDNFMGNPEETLRGLIYDQSIADQLLAMEVSDAERERQLKNRFTTAKLVWHPRSYDPHLPKWLHRIRIPTQLIWGDHDQLFPPRIGEEYERLIPGATLTLLPGCGHLPPIEQADKTAALVVDFVNNVSAGEGAA
ncbi:MAG: alpha/beta hydrolase [Gammaproteobacteria bacterium]|nr:MAG: alpha/beta hydrolase [Gammaproteobacteria bacterium]